MKDKRVGYGLRAVILAGLLSHAAPYLFRRSLWIDEARLASSIVNRSLWNLTASSLDAGQSAPVGYLYLVKLCSMLFGTGEAALRLWSLLAFYGCAAVFCQILQKVVKTERWLSFLAVFVTIPAYIYYGNELKPYMSDCLFVLLAILLYGLYREGSWRLWQLTAACALLLWFSFAAVFYIAGGMILIVMQTLLEGIRAETGRKDTLKKLLCCLPVLVSFLLNYVFWLSATSSNAEGQGYWALVRFPLIPTEISDLRLIGQIVGQMLMPFGSFCFVFGGLFLIGVVRCIWKRRVCAMDLHLLSGALLLLIASWMGFYPIQDRMVLFVSMTMLLFDIRVVEELILPLRERLGTLYDRGMRLCCLLLFCVYLFGDLRYWRPGGVYMVGSEISESLRYLAEHKTEKDMVYVRNEAIPAFLYKMGYPWGTADILYEAPLIRDDYILGQPTFSYDYKVPYSYEGETIEKAVAEDAKLIERFDSVYIYTSHEIAEKKEDTQRLLETLKRSGSVEMVSCYYETFLYYYQRY